MTKTIFLQYSQGTYLRCTIDHVMQEVDSSVATRLVEALYLKDILNEEEVLEIVRPRGGFSAGVDEPYYRDRTI